LSQVSGEALPGEILATMGPSGSGKTSLMNVLSGRAAYQEGSISINGEVLNASGMKRLMSKVAYVKQQDVFFETLTVKDQLTYTAQLRFPDDGDKATRLEMIRSKVDRIIRLLRLTKVENSPIMMCSGGEKKRVNIGTELLTDPSIIMLDEPTSGLDSASSVSLLNVLKDLAKNHGKTIITSIHQPNSATFLNTFDKLLMLADGNVVYFGKPTDSLSYLRDKGYPCPEGYNAADHWMDLLVTDSDSSVTASGSKSPKFFLQEQWDNDAVAEQMKLVSDITYGNEDSNFHLNDVKGSKYPTSWFTQYKTLTDRSFKKRKTTVFSPINIVKTIAIGVVVGIVYFQQSYTENDIQNIYAYFFFTMIHWVLTGMFEAIFSFPQERIVILKERATASYRLSAYFMATTTADLPVTLLMPFVYLVISYWMTASSFEGHFVTFILITLLAFLAVITGQAIGLMIGAAFDDIERGQAVATVLILFLMLLGNFFAKNLPAWISWAQYLSPFAYASNAATQVIFQSPVPCDGSYIFCKPGMTEIPVQELLDSFAVTLPLWANIFILILFCSVPRLVAYGLLRCKKAGERE